MGRHRRTAPVAPGAPPAGATTGRHRGVRPTGTTRTARPTGAARPTVPILTDGTVGPGPHGAPRPDAPSRPGGFLRTAPVRTGLLGVSAALAMGAVAVSAGLLPGTGTYEPGGADGPGGQVRTGALPEVTSTQGGRSPLPADRGTPPADRGAARPDTPGASPSADASADDRGSRTDDSATGDDRPGNGTSDGSRTGSPSDRAGGSGASGDASTATPAETRAAEPAPAGDASAAARVLTLVNKERVTAGCAPLTADGGLTDLAQDFSEDMARRDFFAHTDPDGATPWDRAKTAGIADLGGENIARGQTTPEAVMDSWMNSPGHRANILNCDYRTLGVGLHHSPGGPWWTQDFGF
ncbi:CAP domain-containing protein [Streptomyces sp. NPDC053560]|uniref:CAP domain-containing protein n=1 Tax=Streptomyces sp. NPDC053560 TaxID=3365711 RepID=UPI0037D63D1C